jgi:hypothetical protein
VGIDFGLLNKKKNFFFIIIYFCYFIPIIIILITVLLVDIQYIHPCHASFLACGTIKLMEMI